MPSEPRQVLDGARDQAQRALSVVPNMLLSLFLAPFPARWWERPGRRLGLDVSRVALLSALGQLVLGGLLFAFGYSAWFDAQVEAIVAAAEATGKNVMEQRIAGVGALLGNPILPIIFALSTGQGIVSVWLALGGFVRSIGFALNRETLPDPLLALADWGWRLFDRRSQERMREKRKGEVTPDRVFVGDGSTSWDLCILSRDDHAWRVDAGLMYDGVAYRVLRVTEMRDERDRLRMAYELRRLAPTEVLRGMNVYRPTMPPEVVPPSPSSGPH